jgi:hypothetical protein
MWGLFLSALSSSAHAARPFAADDAGLVAPGTFEIETAGDYWHNAAAFGIGLKHGLTERMDIGLGLGGCILPEHDHGFDAACLGLKFALLPDVLAATFNGVFGDPVYDVNFIYSTTLKNLALNTNVGGVFVATSADADLTYGLASVYSFNSWEVGAEIGGTQHALSWWQIGARFALADWWALDAGLGGNFKDGVQLNATTGLWFAFPLTTGK